MTKPDLVFQGSSKRIFLIEIIDLSLDMIL